VGLAVAAAAAAALRTRNERAITGKKHIKTNIYNIFYYLHIYLMYEK
jgi:hypothetical protein